MSAGAMRATRRLAPPTVVFAAVVALAAAAFAYWAATGSGSASATSGTASAVTLSPATPTAQLVPGGQANVVLTVTNPNSAAVRIGSLALDTTQGSAGFGVDGAHSGCALSALGFATQTNGGAGWTVPGNDSLAVSLPTSLSMASDAANACQGATFTVYLRAAA